MLRTMLKSKIHRARVTEANVEYEGSISIDSALMVAADILENEQVHVVDLDNGARLETYAIAAPAGSGRICMNGAAARLVNVDDRIIVLSYAAVSEAELTGHKVKVVLVDERNALKAVKDSSPAFDLC